MRAARPQLSAVGHVTQGHRFWSSSTCDLYPLVCLGNGLLKSISSDGGIDCVVAASAGCARADGSRTTWQECKAPTIMRTSAATLLTPHLPTADFFSGAMKKTSIPTPR